MFLCKSMTNSLNDWKLGHYKSYASMEYPYLYSGCALVYTCRLVVGTNNTEKQHDLPVFL